MEEVDIGLRVHAAGGRIVMDPMLRIIHDKVLSNTVDPEVNAMVLANTALFPYLTISGPAVADLGC